MTAPIYHLKLPRLLFIAFSYHANNTRLKKDHFPSFTRLYWQYFHSLAVKVFAKVPHKFSFFLNLKMYKNSR